MTKHKARGKLTPEAVAAFAYLHLTDDAGNPIMPAAHHWLWIDLMCNEDIKRLLLIAPPEAAKTTWAILAYAGAHMAFFPERSTIIGSVSGPIAEKRSMALRGVAESAAFAKSFPDVQPVKTTKRLKWSTTEWSLAPNGNPHPGRLHPTIAAYGTGGPVIGSRADLVIGDDLLDFETSRTAHQRMLTESWFHNSFLSRRKARTGRAILIGTAWTHDDLYAKARKEGGWIVCHIPILTEGEAVYANLTYPDNYAGPILGDPIASAMVN